MGKPDELLSTATATRNDAIEFAARTLKNLDFIEGAFNDGEDVHVVTHLGNSLLGLIVFTVEKEFVRFILNQKLDDLAAQGWPMWTIELGTCDTLGELVYHLRNAIAHGRLSFS